MNYAWLLLLVPIVIVVGWFVFEPRYTDKEKSVWRGDDE